MRPVQALSPPGPTASVQQKVDWCIGMILQICTASRDESTDLARPYQVNNLTKQRSLDPVTASTADVARVLGTLLADMKKGGMNRVG